uniref:DUF4349 domain-containing protein n=1 Tax=Anaerococcus mediterraneensis TaxID=1870984 RepID=UPI000930567D|nr:DUF4349 domain-containing protein [Anaerococcus mediterraneensis]
MKKKVLIILISLFAFSSCGSNNYKSYETSDYAKEEKSNQEYPAEAEMAKDIAIDDPGVNSVGEDLDNYIERFVYIQLETIDYDNDLRAIKDSAKSLSGLVENESTYVDDRADRDLKNTDISIKIPKENAEKFDHSLASLGNLRSISKNSNNLKSSFRDVEKNLEIKERQLEKFNELLEKSNNIEDTLVINAKIIECQGEIDAIKKEKADLKDRVTYDTYNISLEEVFSYDKRANNPKLGERIKDAMGESLGILKEFFSQVIVGFFLYWPFVIIIIIVGFFLYRRRKKHKRK